MNDKPKKPENKVITFTDIESALNSRVEKIEDEFRDGFNFIKKYNRTVTFFGSARTAESNSDYIQASSLASRISKELGYTIVTGGSIGIMEAANKGATEEGGKSIGLNIKLPHEQSVNKYLTDYIEFNYFFSRKVCLSFSAEAFIYFPGGFGTMDELFEILTLIQTGKVKKTPIILVGSYFWNNFDKFIKENLLGNEKISHGDTDLYAITDNEDEIIEIIKNAPIRIGFN